MSATHWKVQAEIPLNAGIVMVGLHYLFFKRTTKKSLCSAWIIPEIAWRPQRKLLMFLW